jgi:hypothetical protein
VKIGHWSLVMLLKELDLTMKMWRVKDNQNYEFINDYLFLLLSKLLFNYIIFLAMNYYFLQ